jgi:hypothetical protein
MLRLRRKIYDLHNRIRTWWLYSRFNPNNPRLILGADIGEGTDQTVVVIAERIADQIIYRIAASGAVAIDSRAISTQLRKSLQDNPFQELPEWVIERLEGGISFLQLLKIKQNFIDGMHE